MIRLTFRHSNDALCAVRKSLIVLLECLRRRKRSGEGSNGLLRSYEMLLVALLFLGQVLSALRHLSAGVFTFGISAIVLIHRILQILSNNFPVGSQGALVRNRPIRTNVIAGECRSQVYGSCYTRPERRRCEKKVRTHNRELRSLSYPSVSQMTTRRFRLPCPLLGYT